MLVKTKAIYVIDYEGEKAEMVDPKIIPDSFDETFKKIIDALHENMSVRKYRKKSDTTEVVSLVKRITDKVLQEDEEEMDDWQAFQTIAERLLHYEIEKQAQISRLGRQIKKGSLIQALLQKEDTLEYVYLLAKVEHSTWVDVNDFAVKTGFPSDKKSVWKSCVFKMNIQDNVSEVESARIYMDGDSKYWHNEFLELVEETTDETNTRVAFKSINTLLEQKIRRKGPNDYFVLRNAVIAYFRANRHIDYDQMYDAIFSNYEPSQVDAKDIDNLNEQIQKLPETKKFDRQFSSISSAIKAKIRGIYKVSEEIDINVKEDIEDVKKTIQSVVGEDGVQYIRIKSGDETTFRMFLP